MSQENISYIDYPTERCLFSQEISSLNQDIISSNGITFEHNFEALSAKDIPVTEGTTGIESLSSFFTPKFGQFLMGRKSQDLNCSIFDGLLERFLLTRCDSTYDLSGLCSADFDSIGGDVCDGWGYLEKASNRDSACGLTRRKMMYCYDQSINTIIDKCYIKNTDISCPYGTIYTTNPDVDAGGSIGECPFIDDPTEWTWTYDVWRDFMFQSGDYHNGANRGWYDVTNIDPSWLSCIHRAGDIQKIKDRRRRRVYYDLFEDLRCDPNDIWELDESRKYEKPYVDWMMRYCSECNPISAQPMMDEHKQPYERVYAKYGSLLGPKYSGYGPGLAMNLLQMAGELAIGRPDFEYVPTKCQHIVYDRRIQFNGFSDDPEVTHTHSLEISESTTELPTYQYDLRAIPGKVKYTDEMGVMGLPGPIVGLSVHCDYQSFVNEFGSSILQRRRFSGLENQDATVHIEVDMPLDWDDQTNRTIKRPTKADWPNIHNKDVVESMTQLITYGAGIMEFYQYGDQINAQYSYVDHLNYLNSTDSYVDDNLDLLIESWYDQIVQRLIQIETRDPKTRQVAKYFPRLQDVYDYDDVFGGSFGAQENQIKQEIIDKNVNILNRFEWLVGDVDAQGNGIWVLVDKNGNRRELYIDDDGLTETLWDQEKSYEYNWYYYGERDKEEEKIPLNVRDFAKLRYCFRNAAFWYWKRLQHDYYQ